MQNLFVTIDVYVVKCEPFPATTDFVIALRRCVEASRRGSERRQKVCVELFASLDSTMSDWAAALDFHRGVTSPEVVDGDLACIVPFTLFHHSPANALVCVFLPPKTSLSYIFLRHELNGVDLLVDMAANGHL